MVRVAGAVTMMVSVAMLAAGCPQRTECTGASDCGGMQAGGCSTCPQTAERYCKGGSCEDAPAKTLELTVDLTARNQSILSIRWIVVSFTTAEELPECAGGANCPGNALTCDDLKTLDWSDKKLNIAVSGARGTDNMGGLTTTFLDVPLGTTPPTQHLVAIEGRSGTLGSGDRVSFACLPINEATPNISLTLTPI